MSVNASDLKTVRKGAEDNLFIKLMIDDSGNQTETTSLLKEIQYEPLTGDFFHADFYAFRMDHKLTFDIPIHFQGEPVGIDKGGELQHLKREIKVSCLPSALPEFIPVNIGGLDLGDTILVRDLSFPEGVHCIDPDEVALAMVTSPSVAPTEGETAGAEDSAE